VNHCIFIIILNNLKIAELLSSSKVFSEFVVCWTQQSRSYDAKRSTRSVIASSWKVIECNLVNNYIFRNIFNYRNCYHFQSDKYCWYCEISWKFVVC
jgi:hypothetical protein